MVLNVTSRAVKRFVADNHFCADMVTSPEVCTWTISDGAIKYCTFQTQINTVAVPFSRGSHLVFRSIMSC